MNELTNQGETTFSLSPRNLAEAMEFAKIIASSDMVPKDYINKPGNVLVAVQTGAELGLDPMQSLQGISVINGRPGVWGDAVWALIISHPEFEDVQEEKHDTHCTVTLKRKPERTTAPGSDLHLIPVLFFFTRATRDDCRLDFRKNAWT